MKKKNLITLGIVMAVIVISLLYIHYTPLWVNLQNVIIFAIGVVTGIFGFCIYNKYFKKV